MLPLEVFFLLTLPDAFLTAYVGTRLLRIPVNTKELMLIAFLNACITFIVRSEGIFGHIIKYGVHTVVLLILWSIIMGLVLKISFKVSFAATAIPLFIVLLGDQMLLIPAMKQFGVIGVFELPKHPVKWILYGWIADGLLVAAAAYIRLTGFHLFFVSGLKRSV